MTRKYKTIVAVAAFACALALGLPQAEAGTKMGRSCELDSTRECTINNNGFTYCITCYAVDTYDNRAYQGSACRPSTAAVPTDSELETTAGENAVKGCKNTPNNPQQDVKKVFK